ncbi:MAG TPA: sn-glycerol-3-phosphate ABC transporter ATP-binding protein UgpC [Gaiellaceae bacterium]|jgi:multiple sugar transport system ATP-binding protein|nr:sn-glycerol-3-phosphate ABC transporter ATP-binding protein UgpC [Gaiellaceae bacterium]
MSGITLESVTKVYGNAVKAVDAVDLDIADGEFVVLVGPSGCGKSTLLRMIAGLEDVTDGAIRIGEADVTEQPPQKRDIAMVFQNYALYPHMTVRENLAYGLRLRKLPKAEWTRRVNETAATLGLGELLDRKPSALSGGQRQRVAMGRAIVREPKAFLMDEPLSNLDAKLRVSMRAELAKLHERLHVTTVYVTHDQVEAMTLGQRVAVLRDGVLQQVDTPQNLFHRPVNLFVAAFIGSPSMNLIEADCTGSRIAFADTTIELPAGSPAAGRTGRLIVGIRPTDFEHSSAADPSWPRLRFVPDVVEDLGSEHHVIFTVDAPRVSAEAVRAASDEGDDEGKLFADDRAVFTASVDDRERIPAGTPVELALNHHRLHFFEPDTGHRLAGGPALATL